MEALHSFEVLVNTRIYKSTWRANPKDSNLLQYHSIASYRAFSLQLLLVRESLH